MIDIIKDFHEIIHSCSILIENEGESKKSELKLKIILKDNSILVASEVYINEINKRKYSFHWMHPDPSIIVRWDNALHHKQIKSFPHHKHVESEENVLESHDISFFEVLSEIKKSISQIKK